MVPTLGAQDRCRGGLNRRGKVSGHQRIRNEFLQGLKPVELAPAEQRKIHPRNQGQAFAQAALTCLGMPRQLNADRRALDAG